MMDILGDLFLCGKFIRGHVIASRSGHALNVELVRKLMMNVPAEQKPFSKTLNVEEIQKIIPHRYPFVMIDRVLEFIGNDELVAIKNVTINEPYFTGHFPTNPVMPGVLQLEAMAQAAGIVMLRRTGNSGTTAFFMSADKVKFRRPVRPGDQIIINAKITKVRGDKLAAAECNCTVGGQVVSSAELMFAVVEEGEE
jgi:UDP-3-O-[3-hydroxymyristoyl] N-acetylglucosamine deacetylase/3-hydroxyacyl-[acyl-carrier-protein] dehydratase